MRPQFAQQRLPLGMLGHVDHLLYDVVSELVLQQGQHRPAGNTRPVSHQREPFPHYDT